METLIIDVYERTTCRLCDGARLEQVLTLTPTPPGNHFVAADQVGMPQKSYPLALNMCADCSHVQLTHCVDPETLYRRNYSYVSGTSSVFVAHLRDYADWVVATHAPAPGSLVVDIGANDGTALSFFQAKGFEVLGVDPATEVVAIANERGVETVCEFFNDEIAARERRRCGPAELITSHNACAHIDDLPGVIRGVEHWLADDGLFVMEVGYLLDVVENGWFDTIYHEHVDYHSVTPLVPFFRQHGLEVIDVQRISPQGGSIRVVAQKPGGRRPVGDSVAAILELERQAGLDRPETLRAFGDDIDGIRERLADIIRELRAGGAVIAGFGAPTKATTLLSHFELAEDLAFLIDENPLKQNLFSPGHHIPVYGPEAVVEREPDYILILAWNFADDIMGRYRAFLKAGGGFILPMPEPRVITGA